MAHFTFFQQAGLFVWVIIVGKWYSTPFPFQIFNLPLFSKNMLCTTPSIHIHDSCPYPTSLPQSTSATPSIYPQLPVQLQPYHKVISPTISKGVKYVESKQWRQYNDAFETCNCQLGLDWKNRHHPDSNPSFKNYKNQSKIPWQNQRKILCFALLPPPYNPLFLEVARPSLLFQSKILLPPLLINFQDVIPPFVRVLVRVCVCVCMGRGCQLQ